MRILIVDDEPDVVESVRLGFLLQWREIEILSAATGEDALDVVEDDGAEVRRLGCAGAQLGCVRARSCGRHHAFG